MLMEIWGHSIRRNCANSNRGGVQYVVCTKIVRHKGGHTFSLGARWLGTTHRIFCASCQDEECGLQEELLRHRGGGGQGYNSNTEWGGGEGGGGCRRYRVKGRRNSHRKMVDTEFACK